MRPSHGALSLFLPPLRPHDARSAHFIPEFRVVSRPRGCLHFSKENSHVSGIPFCSAVPDPALRSPARTTASVPLFRRSSPTLRMEPVRAVCLHTDRDRADKLRQEGFEPFMVCQTRVRNEDRREYTKHLIRLRHASQISGDEANEIILLNSHDGTSSYQMLAGMFRFVCHNGLVCGDTADIRVPHKGDVASQVIEGALRSPRRLERVHGIARCDAHHHLDEGEANLCKRSALALKYDDPPSPRLSRSASF